MILSADTGISGALALFDWRTAHVETFAIPVSPTGPDGRNRVDVPELVAVLSLISIVGPTTVVLENTQGRGGQDASRAYQFGRAAGILEGAIVAAGLPEPIFVSPAAWKPRLGVPADKRQSRARASVLLPLAAHQWRLQCQHGSAEAAMLGYYAAHVLGLDGCPGTAAARPRVRLTATTIEAVQ